MNPPPVRRVTVIQGHSVLEFLSFTFDWTKSVQYVSDMDIDSDGVGDDGKPNNIYHDPYYQPDTSLHYNGKPLNAQSDKYVVINPKVLTGVKGVVLGCQAVAVDLRSGKWSFAVVGDIGPSSKDGEASCALADAIGINPNANSGGVSTPDIFYAIWPGLAAVVDGKHYQLQPYGN